MLNFSKQILVMFCLSSSIITLVDCVNCVV